MKTKQKFMETKAGVSAVIGVILMVAITVAIAGTVYVYVSNMYQNYYVDNDTDCNTTRIEYTGVLYGVYSESTGVIVIGNNSVFCNVYGVGIHYLSHLIGQDVTLILNFNNCSGYHSYIGAYVNH